jgi:GAF domain-containing protein
MISTNRLAEVFVEVADTLVDDFDLVEFLHKLARRAAEITEGSAVGLMLSDTEGLLQHMATSTEDARLLELLQLHNHQGPCVDCHRTGEPVSCVDLRTADARWPTFASHAVTLGVLSVHTFPMRLRDRAIGAMNVFGQEAEPLSADRARLVQALADVATIAITQERAIARADVLTEQLQFALDSRLVIEQAKGAVASSLGIGVDEAFEVMRRHARNERIRLTDLAQSLVTDPTAMNVLR